MFFKVKSDLFTKVRVELLTELFLSSYFLRRQKKISRKHVRMENFDIARDEKLKGNSCTDFNIVRPSSQPSSFAFLFRVYYDCQCLSFQRKVIPFLGLNPCIIFHLFCSLLRLIIIRIEMENYYY